MKYATFIVLPTRRRISIFSLLGKLILAYALLTMATPSFAACKGNKKSCKSSKAQYTGPKQVVAVLPFVNRITNVYGAMQLGDGMSEMLTTELVQSGRFLVVERESIRDIIAEQELGLSGLVRKESSIKTGQMSGAQFFIKGAITEFNDQAGGGGISLGYRTGEVGGKTRTAYVGIDVRIVDNTTGQVYASYNASAKARSTGASLATNLTHSGEAFKFGASAFNNTALGVATRKAIKKVIGFILDKSEGIPWQGSIIKAGNTVYLNRGASAGMQDGDKLSVFSKGEALIDPETGFNLGSDEVFLCDLTVTRRMPKFSVARRSPNCEGREIDRGDIVRFQ